MTYAEALQEAKDTCKECLTSNDCVKEECKCYWIIKALEKRIAKKPIEKWTGDEWVIKCPVCGNYFDVSEYEWARQFCGGCGQAIDWECDTDE